MSEDYGLLETIREVLMNDETIQSTGLSQRIYNDLPSKPVYPFICLEIDTIWHDHTASDNQAIARINFHINLFSHVHLGTTPAHIGHTISTCLDAHSIRLSPYYLANFRKTANIIDLPMMRSPRLFQQFYQAIIWKKIDKMSGEAI